MELSKRITNDDELMELGIKVLNFPKDTIKQTRHDHRDSIQAATHELLSKWLKKQPTRQEAYMNLQAGLKRAQMHHLTVEGAEGTPEGSQVTDEGKQILSNVSPCGIAVYYILIFEVSCFSWSRNISCFEYF